MYQESMGGLSSLATRIRMFRGQITTIIKFYFEPSTRRNSAAYIDAYSRFYSQMISITAHYFNEDSDQNSPVEVSFIPVVYPTEEGKVFVAEETTFNSLLDFLRTELYRGLAIGNAPRRYHNYGRYFLLTAGYDTCYCSNIAPGETERTCRKVGARRKEAQGKANRTPAQVEYDRIYNRLKQRKNRRKISIDEWDTVMAKAQEFMEQAGRGKLTDAELKRQLELL